MPRLRLRTFVDVRPGEVGALLLSFAYFFLLLCSYYILRPIRDAWGIEGGTDKLPWLFTGTFVTMLAVNPIYSAVVTRGTRRRIVPVVYRFFALNLLVFYALLRLDAPREPVGHVFFVWISVYNVFVVAIFWSFMADLFSNEQGRRLFGFIAVGGSLGALAGPLLAKFLAEPVGVANLLLLSAVLLEACTQCVGWLLRHCEARPETMSGAAAGGDVRVGGSILGGIRLVFSDRYMLGIAAQILCLTTTATFLYLLQARIVHAAGDDTEARAAIFANIDLTVNALEFALQLCVTAPLIRLAGLGNALRVLPVVTALGSIALAWSPTVLVLTAFQGARRAIQYAVYRPARELLFTVVDRERKYASKGFIDTVVYRGGDWASAQLFAGLDFLGLKIAGLALAGLPVAAGWFALSGFLARRQQELAQAQLAVTGVPYATAQVARAAGAPVHATAGVASPPDPPRITPMSPSPPTKGSSA
jgi:ATP:ADP antiporter, AAA family